MVEEGSKDVASLRGQLPDSWCKEEFSVAYVHAVATAIGVSCETPHRDMNGVDAIFRARDDGDTDGAQLAMQLKCTTKRLRSVNGEAELSFPLGRKDYDHLRMVRAHPPRLLVVVKVPDPPPSSWVEVSAEQLLLRASAWYATLWGEPALPDGQDTKSIRIPATNRFTPEALSANMRSCP